MMPTGRRCWPLGLPPGSRRGPRSASPMRRVRTGWSRNCRVRPAFRLASEARGESGFAGTSEFAFALRHQAGPWGLTMFGEQGDAYLAAQRRLDSVIGSPREHRPVRSMGLAVDRRFGGGESSLALSWMAEEQTVLGAWFHESLGAHGADSAFADLSLRTPLGERWQLGGSYRQGLTMARTSLLITGGSRLWRSEE